jgi:SAM-dependent methyltransferase
MTFKYSEAVPWGRSFDEYCRMFDLSEQDLKLRILGCGDGPASFNAEMSQLGHRVVSCDPIYELSTAQIQERIDVTYENVMRQTHENQHNFVWTRIKSPEELGKARLAAMREFLADFDSGKRDGRYVTGELPDVPFESNSYDLAVCSHFLFLYSDILSFEFHQRAIEEMCRVAREARIFPLLNYNAKPSPFVEPLLKVLADAGYNTSVEVVPYEFQRGGNQMLRVRKAASA